MSDTTTTSTSVSSQFVQLLRETSRNLYKGKRGVYIAAAIDIVHGEQSASVWFGYDLLDQFGNVVGSPRYEVRAHPKITTHSNRPPAVRYVTSQSQGYTAEIVGTLTGLANVLRAGDELIVSFTFGSKNVPVGDTHVVQHDADITIVRKGKGIATFRLDDVVVDVAADAWAFATTFR